MNEYPTLSLEGIAEFEKLIEAFKDKMRKAADEVLSEAYINLPAWIETDSWSNFRNEVIGAHSVYSKLDKWSAKKVREKMLFEERDLILKDLNQDLVEENESLQRQIQELETERWGRQ